jgi:hypothetical protein
MSVFNDVTPVMFPPGWPRLGTRPRATTSPPAAKTIGIVVVADLAAVPPPASVLQRQHRDDFETPQLIIHGIATAPITNG